MANELALRDDPTLIGVAKYLGLDPSDIKAQAAVVVCRRYGLDVLLGHVAIVKNKVYITRDGMLDVAHRSGVFDGMKTEEERESEHGWSATVSVFRKDMSHPFTYRGGCGINEPQAQEGHGAEQALARAERRALRRAFNIPAYDGADDGIAVEVVEDHQLITPADPKDRWMTCTCGERFPTAAAFAAHKTPGSAQGTAARGADAPVSVPAGPGPTTYKSRKPGRRPVETGPPVDYYDSLPEARGYA